ncbi:hypothetical protein GCM10007036_33100 [Alsobacter metallidurans]|uniref:Methyl-accepting transducer domain-containing protein n=1 Tax=Alsobacter metallidurans TaxID=340221 RepID=A0A917I8C9_9HYPH|nr:methyl-accepting chemotaxis protein [Alsobacter metallidurans]GGH25768.1 hypothetical protein GCM10007036_33100 [Alsobacter metallidurans]
MLSRFISPIFRERAARFPIAVGATLAIVMWAGLGSILVIEHGNAGSGAQRKAADMATLFAESAGRTIREVDKILLLIRALYEEGSIDVVTAAYSGRASQFDSLTFQLSIVSPDGVLVMSNMKPATERVDISDREHFKVHRERSEDRLYISKPLLGRASGRWSIQLTRAIKAPNGGFGGVIVASIDPDHFSRLYESVDLGRDGVVGLFGLDGIVRTRRGQQPNSTGLSVVGTPMFETIRNGAEGSYRLTSPIDGIERIGAFRRVTGQDLVVAVGLSTQEAFAALQRRGVAIALMGLLGMGLIAGAVVLSIRARLAREAFQRASQLATEQLAELALRDEREKLAQRDAEVLAGVEKLSGHLGSSIETLDTIIHAIGEQSARMNQAAIAARDGSAGAAEVSNASARNVDAVAGSAITISDMGIEAERAVSGALATFDEAIAEADRSNGAFDELLVATQQIDRVVQLIRSIAHQTNMLALNATIEAARAGEAGRGFSVVAQEIKNLSAQTSLATGEISDQLTAIQRAGRTSIESVRAVQERLSVTRDTTEAIAGTVARQSYSASEIAMRIATAAQTAADASRSADAIRAAAELSNACASDVLATTRTLEAEAHTVRVEIEALHRSLRQSRTA